MTPMATIIRTATRRLLPVAGLLALATASPLAAQAGAGAKYGTRDPVVCARGSGPRGAPSAAQVAQLVRCDREGEGSSSVTLVENLRVEVARPRAYVHVQDSWEDVDPRQPVYPIRGSQTLYACEALRTPRELAAGFADNRGANCRYWREPRAEGVCFRDHAGDWHCKLYDHSADLVTGSTRGVPPPR